MNSQGAGLSCGMGARGAGRHPLQLKRLMHTSFLAKALLGRGFEPLIKGLKSFALAQLCHPSSIKESLAGGLNPAKND